MIILSFLTVGNVKQYEISSFKGQKFLFEWYIGFFFWESGTGVDVILETLDVSA